MKTRTLILSSLIFAAILLGSTSCLVVRTDNGHHRGWHKNPKNPHNPISTNPGRGHGHGKGK